MTPELTVLALVTLLQLVQLCLYSVAAQKQVGSKTAAGPRDVPLSLTGVAGRLQRTVTNLFEGLVLFTAACVVVTLSGQSGPLSATCAWVYLAARVLYLPAYVFGWVPWRSAIWGVGFCAIALMLLSALV